MLHQPGEKARLCLDLEAQIPQIVSQPALRLRSARHPLLILRLGHPRQVVPFNLDLGGEARIILLSGPNTGGKTVLMKSVGLLTLMALIDVIAGFAISLFATRRDFAVESDR